MFLNDYLVNINYARYSFSIPSGNMAFINGDKMHKSFSLSLSLPVRLSVHPALSREGETRRKRVKRERGQRNRQSIIYREKKNEREGVIARHEYLCSDILMCCY